MSNTVADLPYELKDVPVDLIDLSWVHLRQVEENTADFNTLVDSVRNRGVLQPILIRRIEVDGSPTLSLIDGNRRYQAAKKAGCENVPAKILSNCSDIAAMQIQLEANIQAKSVTVREIKKHMYQIISMSDDEITLAELSVSLHKPFSYTRNILGFDTMNPGVYALVERGDITLVYATTINKLPQDKQPEWVDKVKHYSPGDFRTLVSDYIRSLPKKVRALPDGGRADEITVHPRLRKIEAIKKALTDPEVARSLIRPGMALEDAVLEGIKFTVQMDAGTYEQRFEKAKRDSDVEKRKSVEAEIETRRAQMEKLQSELEKLEKET